jgi:hypothetical protein
LHRHRHENYENCRLDLPALAFVVVTAALAAGIGLFRPEKLAARVSVLHWAMLLGVGAATTIPAVISVLRDQTFQIVARRATGRA